MDNFMNLLEQFEMACQIDWNASNRELDRQLEEKSRIRQQLIDMYDD